MVLLQLIFQVLYLSWGAKHGMKRSCMLVVCDAVSQWGERIYVKQQLRKLVYLHSHST